VKHEFFFQEICAGVCAGEKLPTDEERESRNGQKD
jgi:hypothetical protein